MEKIKVEKVKPLVMSDYKQMWYSEYFAENCSCADFVYTLLLHIGYVNVTDEVTIREVRFKYKRGYINYKHFTFQDGLECCVFYRNDHYNPYKNTIKECISLGNVSSNCVILMGLYTLYDGLYVYEGQKVKPIKVVGCNLYRNF